MKDGIKFYFQNEDFSKYMSETLKRLNFDAGHTNQKKIESFLKKKDVDLEGTQLYYNSNDKENKMEIVDNDDNNNRNDEELNKNITELHYQKQEKIAPPNKEILFENLNQKIEKQETNKLKEKMISTVKEQNQEQKDKVTNRTIIEKTVKIDGIDVVGFSIIEDEDPKNNILEEKVETIEIVIDSDSDSDSDNGDDHDHDHNSNNNNNNNKENEMEIIDNGDDSNNKENKVEIIDNSNNNNNNNNNNNENKVETIDSSDDSNNNENKMEITSNDYYFDELKLINKNKDNNKILDIKKNQEETKSSSDGFHLSEEAFFRKKRNRERKREIEREFDINNKSNKKNKKRKSNEVSKSKKKRRKLNKPKKEKNQSKKLKSKIKDNQYYSDESECESSGDEISSIDSQNFDFSFNEESDSSDSIEKEVTEPITHLDKKSIQKKQRNRTASKLFEPTETNLKGNFGLDEESKKNRIVKKIINKFSINNKKNNNKHNSDSNNLVVKIETLRPNNNKNNNNNDNKYSKKFMIDCNSYIEKLKQNQNFEGNLIWKNFTLFSDIKTKLRGLLSIFCKLEQKLFLLSNLNYDESKPCGVSEISKARILSKEIENLHRKLNHDKGFTSDKFNKVFLNEDKFHSVFNNVENLSQAEKIWMFQYLVYNFEFKLSKQNKKFNIIFKGNAENFNVKLEVEIEENDLDFFNSCYFVFNYFRMFELYFSGIYKKNNNGVLVSLKDSSILERLENIFKYHLIKSNIPYQIFCNTI